MLLLVYSFQSKVIYPNDRIADMKVSVIIISNGTYERQRAQCRETDIISNLT